MRLEGVSLWWHPADGLTKLEFCYNFKLHIPGSLPGTCNLKLYQKFSTGIATKKAAPTKTCPPALAFVLPSGSVFISELCELQSQQTIIHLQLISTGKCKTVT